MGLNLLLPTVFMKAVITDFAGVLVYDGFPPTVGKYARTYGVPEEELQKAKDNFWSDFSLGKMRAIEYWYSVFNEVDLELNKFEIDKINKDVLEAHYPHKCAFDFFKALKGTEIKTCLLTNTPKEWFVELDGKFGLSELFDLIVIPYRVGYRKPETVIYSLPIQEFGIEPAEAVYLDDQLRMVKPALDIGMNGVQFVPKNGCNMPIKLDGL